MNSFPHDELPERISRLLDGEMLQVEVDALDAELRASPRARILYLQLASLHSALEYQFQSHAKNQPSRIIPIELYLLRQRRRIVRIALMVAAAVLLLVAIPMWIKIMKHHELLARFQTTTDAVYSLSHTKDFSESAGQTLYPGSRLKLGYGRLEAKFSSGTRCVLEAPCELHVLADDHVRIKQGVAWFHVPSQAVGFKVDTRRLRITDLGTEFGVLASNDGRDEIHVIKGSVQVSSFISGKTGNPEILKSGYARQTNEAGELIQIAIHASPFSTRLTEPLAIRNANFDAPPMRGEVYTPAGYGPIFAWGTSGRGIGISDISQPFLNGRPAHSGTHAAFIQMEGSISQTVGGFDPEKQYTVTYFVNERGLPGASISTAVSLDLGSTFYREPKSILKTDAFRRIVSGPLPVYGPAANITISGRETRGDASLLIDSVSISRAAPRVPEGGFENPVLPARSFNQDNGQIGESPWFFKGGAGMIANRSAFGAPSAPEGSQAAVFQDDAAIETAVQGFEPGNHYRLHFSASARASGGNSLRVSFGGDTLRFDGAEILKPTSKDFQPFASEVFEASAETLTLRIQSSGSGSTFCDDIYLEFVSEDRENFQRLASPADSNQVGE